MKYIKNSLYLYFRSTNQKKILSFSRFILYAISISIMVTAADFEMWAAPTLIYRFSCPSRFAGKRFEAEMNIAEVIELDDKDWKDYFPSSEIPILRKKAKKIHVELLKLETPANTNALRFKMPDGKANLIWTPWPSHISKIKPRPDMHVHTFGVSSRLNDTSIPNPIARGEVPDWVNTGMRHMANLLGYGDPQAVTQCVREQLRCGDDQMMYRSYQSPFFYINNDIMLLIQGSARDFIFKTKGTISSDVLSLNVPEGVLIMEGRSFQKRYEHAIATKGHRIGYAIKKTLFSKKRKAEDYLEAQDKLQWILNNSDVVKKLCTRE